MKFAERVAACLLAVVITGSAIAKEPESAVRIQLLTDGLQAPLFLISPPDQSGRRFVGDQQGVIYVIAGDGKRMPAPFLDLKDRMVRLLQAFDERGLWSLAFHPAFSSNGRFFVTYSAKRRPASRFKGKTAYTWRLSEFKVSTDNPNHADMASERVVLELDWVNRKHNGGGLAFGPDGLLYVGVGDGGGVHGVPDVYIPPKLDEKELKKAAEIKEDPFRLPRRFHTFDRYAQDLSKLQGKILRLDVSDPAKPYDVPVSNPFRGDPHRRGEIYAWGFRNPFRLAFDRVGSGDFLVNGVAETLWETVYLVDRAGNYGWALREGTHCFDRLRAFDPPADCASLGALNEPIRKPIVEYANWSVKRPWSKVKRTPHGTANVGGFIYRGSYFPQWRGKLVFGDFSAHFSKPSGLVFVASPPATWGALWSFKRVLEIDQRLHSLGEDGDGELYLMTTERGVPVGATGKVWKLVPR